MFLFYREATRSDYDYVTVQYGGGCSSQVGKYGGEQLLTLGPYCYNDKTVAHEFIHAFGFWHEHNRPDRDQYVQILEQNIEFNQDHNFAKRRNSLTFGLPYDGLSVMHYQSNFFSIGRNEKTIISKVNHFNFVTLHIFKCG